MTAHTSCERGEKQLVLSMAGRIEITEDFSFSFIFLFFLNFLIFPPFFLFVSAVRTRHRPQTTVATVLDPVWATNHGHRMAAGGAKNNVRHRGGRGGRGGGAIANDTTTTTKRGNTSNAVSQPGSDDRTSSCWSSLTGCRCRDHYLATLFVPTPSWGRPNEREDCAFFFFFFFFFFVRRVISLPFTHPPIRS